MSGGGILARCIICDELASPLWVPRSVPSTLVLSSRGFLSLDDRTEFPGKKPVSSSCLGMSAEAAAGDGNARWYCLTASAMRGDEADGPQVNGTRWTYCIYSLLSDG